MSSEPVFSDSGRWWLAGGGIALAVVLFFMIFGQGPSQEPSSAGADVYSRSWVGYRALVELLGEVLPVHVARRDPVAIATLRRPLLVLEPPIDKAGLARLHRILDTAQRRAVPVVVVLPKWHFSNLPSRPGWVERVSLRDTNTAAKVLRAMLGIDQDRGRVYRSSAPLSGVVDVAASRPELAALAALAIDLPQPQILTEPWPELDPILSSGPALLIVKAKGRELYVVTDPDLWNTGGLGRAQHAPLAERLFVDVLGAEGLVVDASFTHPAPPREIWSTLLDFPLVCVTLHLALLLALVLWASCFRFGRPLVPPPRIAPGKATLIDTTARLLAESDDLEEPARRYLQLVVRQLSERWSVSAELGSREQVTRLAQLARARGVRANLTVLARQVEHLRSQPHDARRVLSLARALYRFRQEALDESR